VSRRESARYRLLANIPEGNRGDAVRFRFGSRRNSGCWTAGRSDGKIGLFEITQCRNLSAPHTTQCRNLSAPHLKRAGMSKLRLAGVVLWALALVTTVAAAEDLTWRAMTTTHAEQP